MCKMNCTNCNSNCKATEINDQIIKAVNDGLKIQAKWNKSGNIKIGGIWSWSTLMGNDEIMIDKYGFAVTGTCGGHCLGCKEKCYVRKSYRYPSVKLGHARNTLALRINPDQAADQLISQIKRAKKQPAGCRFNQSGEIENIDQAMAFIKIAKACPDKFFYIYTKAYDVIVPLLLDGAVPENMTVLISIWHEYGIEAYNLVKHLNNVKAFVYDDGFNYSAFGLTITTWCHAYDINGKMDHDITCDKCRKCFNRNNSAKVIGCYDH